MGQHSLLIITHYRWDCKQVYPPWKSIWWFLRKLETVLPEDPAKTSLSSLPPLLSPTPIHSTFIFLQRRMSLPCIPTNQRTSSWKMSRDRLLCRRTGLQMQVKESDSRWSHYSPKAQKTKQHNCNICRWCTSVPSRFLGCQFSLSELLRAQFIWFCEYACGVIDTSGSYYPLLPSPTGFLKLCLMHCCWSTYLFSLVAG